jgi:hypothetical protein
VKALTSARKERIDEGRARMDDKRVQTADEKAIIPKRRVCMGESKARIIGKGTHVVRVWTSEERAYL